VRDRLKIIAFLVLFVIVFLSIPGTAFAGWDEYGYNAKARKYKGTLENWENLLMGEPAVPWDPKATGVIFLERKWDKKWDAMMSGDPPTGPGAWQKAELWEYLSGDQLGWTWHLKLKVVYSPDAPIPSAMEVPTEEIGFPGFYLVEREEWLSGPKGEKKKVEEMSVKSRSIQPSNYFWK